MIRPYLAMAASVLLYLGPVLAGWAMAPAAAWPVFLGVFLLWSVLMRPGDWPRDAGRWLEAGVIARALVTVVVLAGLAVACLALGWMLGKVTPLPELGPWPGVLLSLVGLLFARMVWSPTRVVRRDPAAETERRRAEAAAAEARLAERRRRGEEMEVDSVIAFTADTPPERIAEVMADLSMRFAPGRLVEGFKRLWKGGRMNAAQKRALILLATDPDQARRLSGHEAGVLALQVCAGETLLTEQFLRRYGTLLDVVPDAMSDGPSNALLRQVEKGFEGKPVAQMVRAMREKQLRLTQGDRALAGGAENS
ncbi:MAG: hypothetical protein RIR62_495 [Pseudomonadota bacterium]